MTEVGTLRCDYETCDNEVSSSGVFESEETGLTIPTDVKEEALETGWYIVTEPEGEEGFPRERHFCDQFCLIAFYS